MSIIGSNILAGASGQGGFTIEESLRFNASQSSYLSWTPATAGNRKTWTWSGWVKLGAITANSFGIFGGGTVGSNWGSIEFDGSTGQIYVRDFNGSSNDYLITGTPNYRDYSAWYHLVVKMDNTQATSSFRLGIWINGVAVPVTGTYPTQNTDYRINSATDHRLMRYMGGAANYLDGYLTEVNFIDGQALDPSSFGEFDSVTGVWKPAKYTGTYGTNGFYLPMQLDNTVEGFNTVTWVGTGAPQKISGVGFSPDLVWGKSRTNVRNHNLYDSVRGVGNMLLTNGANAELTGGELTGFTSDGFTLGSNVYQLNASGDSMVAWCWDAGDTTVSNTDGSITSSVRASTDYGFSVVTYTGTGANATVGHGLGTAPSMVIVKDRVAATSWQVYHSSLGGTDAILLNSTGATFASSVYWNNTNPTSSVFSIGTSSFANTGSNTYVAYCWSEIDGFSKFGSYTGTGASGNTVTTGFKPAFVMVKRTDSTGGWSLFDNTRDPVNPIDVRLQANVSDAENSSSTIEINFNADGFEIDGTATSINASGGTYVYMAFKDTREYAYWLDDSGNNNDWQPNGGITTSSTVTDTPTPYAGGGNYAVLNPLNSFSTSVAPNEANLRYRSDNSAWRSATSTLSMSQGKWYAEFSCSYIATGSAMAPGIVPSTTNFIGTTNSAYTVGYGYFNDGNTYAFGAASASGTTYATDDVIGIAFDADDGKLWFSKNGVWIASGDPATGANPRYSSITGEWCFALGSFVSHSGTASFANFGQRPFAYTPPTGFLPLHTGNLPDSAIVDGSEYFNPVLYNGAGGAQSITGVGFQSDFTWIKSRTAAYTHGLFDSNRGVQKLLQSNSTAAEITSSAYVTSFNSDGFSIGGTQFLNGSGETFVSWNWKANGAGVSNDDGSITSTVSANPTSGFSIVTYVGNSTTNASIGHGLGVAPDLIIHKNRSVVDDFSVWSSAYPNTTGYKLLLNSTAGFETTSNYPTIPTSSVFYVGAGQEVNGSGNNMVAYCFAEVEGYSKFGSYTGNGSADGTFVHLGFKPAFVITKQSSASGQSWQIQDSTREAFNDANRSVLFPDLSNNESTDAFPLDFLSNGFKIRNSGSGNNASGATYIYMAFAENPFKNSLAR